MLPEFYWLTLTLLFTCLMWVPYIVQYLGEEGVKNALSSGEGTKTPDKPWAARLKRAHANAVENMVIFAPLVVIAVMTQTNSQLTAIAAMVYFIARIAHAVIYTLGIPLARGLSFATGLACQLIFAFSILGWI
ncbi:MAG: MAPEG family protein [Alphaproteobacteria bacterium]|nr:MAPEG family protein [Alphaproteobacteria bacterium]